LSSLALRFDAHHLEKRKTRDFDSFLFLLLLFDIFYIFDLMESAVACDSTECERMSTKMMFEKKRIDHKKQNPSVKEYTSTLSTERRNKSK